MNLSTIRSYLGLLGLAFLFSIFLSSKYLLKTLLNNFFPLSAKRILGLSLIFIYFIKTANTSNTFLVWIISKRANLVRLSKIIANLLFWSLFNFKSSNISDKSLYNTLLV